MTTSVRRSQRGAGANSDGTGVGLGHLLPCDNIGRVGLRVAADGPQGFDSPAAR